MKKRALIVANSNLFTVYSQLLLKETHECTALNVRYSNEKMNRSTHFIQQIKDVFNHDLYQKGLTFSKYEFGFNQALTMRLDAVYSHIKPSIIFFEMKTMQPAEWLTLDYMHKHFACPVAVWIPAEEDHEQTILRLFKNGVKEVITRLDEHAFRDIIRRNQ